MREDDPGADHGSRGGRVGRIPRDDCHGTVFVGIARSEGAVGKNNRGVGAGGDGGVAGDFEGAHQLAEGLFTATASGEAFEGGDADGGEEAHDSDDGEKFDEGEGRLLTQRTPRSEREIGYWGLEIGDWGLGNGLLT